MSQGEVTGIFVAMLLLMPGSLAAAHSLFAQVTASITDSVVLPGGLRYIEHGCGPSFSYGGNIHTSAGLVEPILGGVFANYRRVQSVSPLH
jgi:hypothetical protein